MKTSQPRITEQDIQRALRQFQLAGGKIHHIPDQATPRLAVVRSRSDSFAVLMDAAMAAPTAASDAPGPTAE